MEGSTSTLSANRGRAREAIGLREVFQSVTHMAPNGLVPILGILAFVPGFLVAIGVGGSIFDFISPLPYPFSVVGPVVGIWYLIGIVYLIYLYSKAPERVRDTAKVFIEDEAAEAPVRM